MLDEEMKMEDQAKKLVKDELELRIQEIESRFQRQMEQELVEIREQLRIIAASTTN